MTWSLTKLGPFGPTLGEIHNPTHQNRVLGNTRELLVGIKPRMSRSTTNPKPPTARMNPNKLMQHEKEPKKKTSIRINTKWVENLRVST